MAWATPALLAALLAAAPPGADGPPPPAAPARGCGGCARLRLTVAGVRSASGQLLVNVFVAPEGWPKPERALRALRVPATPGEVELALDGLPDLPFAVSVVHDENGNGTLDMRWLPFPSPTEGTAASNGATGTLGPPSFADALVPRAALDEAHRVSLRY